MPIPLSIIIPVYGEAETIHERVNELIQLNFPWSVEIIICDGHPQGTTIGELEAVSLPQVRCLCAPRGRGPQMNAGARAARGEIFLFLHADTGLDQTGADLLVQAIGAAGNEFQGFCGAFDLAIDAQGPHFRLIEKFATKRSRLTRLPYGDQALFFSRALFEDVGGFPRVPIMEDVGIMQRVKRAGHRPCFIPHPVSTSARRWQEEGALYTTLRNWTLILLYLAGVSPHRLSRFY